MKNRSKSYWHESYQDYKNIFVFTQACTVTDFNYFEGEKIKLYRAGVSNCASHVEGWEIMTSRPFLGRFLVALALQNFRTRLHRHRRPHFYQKKLRIWQIFVGTVPLNHPTPVKARHLALRRRVPSPKKKGSTSYASSFFNSFRP